MSGSSPWGRRRCARSSTDRFDGEQLFAALAPYAALKAPPFDFEASSYCKSRRSQAPDRAGIARYRLLLQEVLKVAPGGFPNHGLLRDVWLALDQKHSIRSQCIPHHTSNWDWASACPDAPPGGRGR